jgi:DNA mismatch repair protein MutS2
MAIDERSLELLEFASVRETVASSCMSEEGRDLVLSQIPFTDPGAAAECRDFTSRFTDVLRSGEEMPQLSFPAVASILPKLGKEGVALDEEDLLALAIYVESALKLKRYLSSTKSGGRLDTAPLAGEAEKIPDIPELPRAVFAVIERDGTMRDLVELRDIRSRIRALQRDIETLTSRYLFGDETRSFFQSGTTTLRDGRAVLPLKANFKGRVRGVVHEVSATGQTVYIEPDDVLEKNNRVVWEENDLKQEILKILRRVTAEVSVHAEALGPMMDEITFLDGIYARARYGIDHDSSFATLAESGITLKGARHPLLGRKAVPIDLALESGTRVVIITGPNTGGKTIALKTAGLLAAMNQFGLALPVREGSTIAHFDGIYADIGDEQSISQSLSTFSGHMTAIASIVERATKDSLVLLDELGSGTDPEEGSAIAMSLLDSFIESGSVVLITTHHGILKNYGYTRPGVVNASVDFDSRTLSPTYRILMGIPGESHALDVAEHNHIPKAIIDRARSYLKDERANVSELIKGLKTKHRELEDLEREQLKKRSTLMEDIRSTDLKALRLKQKELELRERGISDLNRLLVDSRSSLENLVRELKEGELTREKTVKVKEFIKELETRVKVQEESYVAEVEAEAPKPLPGEPIREGIQVLVEPGRRRGTVVRKAKKGFWTVETDTIRVTVPESSLTAVRESRKPSASVTYTGVGTGEAPAFELDLRGRRFEEAMSMLEHQLDLAAMAGLSEFGVIHGKGDGILMKGVHEYLKGYRGVVEYFFALPEQGGAGKTIVRMK